MELNSRIAVFISFFFASVGAMGLYAYRNPLPTCESEQALNRVDEVLRDEYHLDSIFVNNIQTVSREFFSDRRECSAEVAPIRGNVKAADMPWQEVRYQIERRAESESLTITVKLGSTVPLARPPPSLWARLRARL
jgi:hypothetical protein